MVTSHVLDHRAIYGDPDLKSFTNCDFRKSDKEDVNFILKHLCDKGFVNVTETSKLHKDNGWEIGFYEMKSEDKWYYIKPDHHGFTTPGESPVEIIGNRVIELGARNATSMMHYKIFVKS